VHGVTPHACMQRPSFVRPRPSRGQHHCEGLAFPQLYPAMHPWDKVVACGSPHFCLPVNTSPPSSTADVGLPHFPPPQTCRRRRILHTGAAGEDVCHDDEVCEVRRHLPRWQRLCEFTLGTCRRAPANCMHRAYQTGSAVPVLPPPVLQPLNQPYRICVKCWNTMCLPAAL
jgi:hypothetical protein